MEQNNQTEKDVKTLRYNAVITRIKKLEQQYESLDRKIDLIIKSLRR